MDITGVVAILAVFGMPVVIMWIKRHYAALEKGVIKPRQGPLFVLGAATGGADKRELESIKQEKRLLEERVRNLESIVCSVDMELNARLNRLALEARSGGSFQAPALAMGRPNAGTSPTVPALRPLEPNTSRIG